MSEIALAMNKTERAVSQKYLKLFPPTNSTRRKVAEKQMSEEMKIKLLSLVAKHKSGFWNTIARDIGDGFTAVECETEYNAVIRNRG